MRADQDVLAHGQPGPQVEQRRPHLRLHQDTAIGQLAGLCQADAAVPFAVEEAISNRRWIYIPLAVALIGLVTVFHLYLSAVLLSLYVPMRLVEIYGWKPRVLSRVSVQLAAVAFLGGLVDRFESLV